MADNGFKINKSANFNPQAGAPANPVDGDFFYDSIAQSFAYYHNGSWANFDSVGTVTDTLWLTGAQFTPAVVRNSVIKVTGAVALSHLAGIASSFSARRITIYNDGAYTIVVEPQDAMESTANNRIQTPTGGSMNLVAGEVAVFTYDIVVNRWLLVSISSQAGAQLIATISNPGLVTLHQASLFPLDGVVLSDGDLNTANGVVGLDVYRAATIATPLASVTALTINAYASASALIWYDVSSTPVGNLHSDGLIIGQAYKIRQGGSLSYDETEFVLDNTDIQLGRRKLHFSKDDGAANILDNYLTYATLATTSTRGIKHIGQTSVGSAYQILQSTEDGFGGVQSELILNASTGSGDKIVANVQGNLHLNYTSTGSIVAYFGSGSVFSWNSGSAGLWQITSSGALQGLDANRPINNVADPTALQDVATKAYVDRNASALNLIINGNFDFWQRGAAVKNLAGCNKTATHVSASTVYDIRYGADRWYAGVSDSSVTTSGNTCNLTRQSSGLNTSPFCCRVTGVGNALADVLLFDMTQEIDRDIIPQIRGKNLIVQFKIRANATYIANGENTQIRLISGTDAGGNVLRQSYAGYVEVMSTQQISNSSLTSSFQTFTYVSGSTVPTNCTELALNFAGCGAAATTNYFEIAEVMVFADLTTVPNYFVRHGMTFGAELRACLKYYEKSYELDTTPGTITDIYKDGSHTCFWPSQIQTSTGSAIPIGHHPRYKVYKWRPDLDGIKTTLYRRDLTDATGVWFVTGNFTQPVSTVGSNGQQGFIVLADASYDAIGVAADLRTIDGHWASSADIGDSA